MKQNDKYLAEGLDILNREFGQPLPTLEDTTKAYKEIKFGSKAQYDKYERQHQIRPGTEIEIDGKKSKEKGDVKPDKKVDKQMSKAADDANAKMDAAEKAEKKKKLNYDSVDDFEDSLDDNPDFEKDLSDDEKDKLGDLLDLWQNAQSDKEQDPDGGDHDGDIEDAKKEINKLLKLENKANRVVFLENPIVAATVMQMTKMQMKNPKTGRTIKAITPLKNKEHPLHKKSKGIFAKIKDAMKKKKKDVPKKQSKSDADFYKKQFTGEIKEGPDDKRAARRVLSKIAKTETKFRKEMYELEQAFLQDPRTENKKAAKDIKKAYKDGVTKFMRDSVKLIKGMK